MAGMTASQMMYEAKVIYEALASADARGYTNREWSTLLTQAQEDVVLEICTEGIDRDEDNRRSIANLLHSLKISNAGYSTDGTTTTSAVTRIAAFGEYPNAYQVSIIAALDTPLITNHLITLNERAEATSSGTTYVNIQVEPIQYDSYMANKDNPFRKPSKELFWRLEHPGGENLTIPGYPMRRIIITNGFTLSAYYMDYLSKPDPIIVASSDYTSSMYIDGKQLSLYTTTSLDCKLDPIVHRRIVKKAAKLAYAYMQEQLGYQIQNIEEQDTQ